jgi:cytochrome c oxidase subunit II
MNFLPQASTLASRTDQIFLVVFMLSLVFLVVITAVMVYFVIRYSRKRHPKAEQIEGHAGLELTWTLIPLALFLGIFYFGWTTWDYGRRAPRDAMVVKVTGRQWNWLFEYPNGKQTGKLYAVVDRPMKLEIRSADVLHGFFVPAFRIKADAVPGRTNTTWFQATELGSFDIECTVICGVDHSRMLGTVEVVSENAFKAWYFGPEGTEEPRAKSEIGATASLGASHGTAPEPLAAGVMRQKGCLGCHSTDGVPMTGPTFKGLLGRREEVIRHGKAEWVTMDEGQIALAIREPSHDVVRGFPPMPPVALEHGEIQTLVEYIKSLQ